MQGKLLSISKIREIISLLLINHPLKRIEDECKVSKSTIEKYKNLLSSTSLKTLDDLSQSSDDELVGRIFGTKAKIEKKNSHSVIKIIKQLSNKLRRNYHQIDTNKYVEKIVSSPSTPISSIYKEYVKEAKSLNKEFFKTTAFRKALKKELLNQKIERVSMHRMHKYGDELELDWCGSTVKLNKDGLEKQYYVLVLTWAASYYCFATLVEDLTTKKAVNGICEGLKYFGVKPNILLIDNARALVKKHKFGHEAIINDSFNHFCRKCSIIVNANNPGRANEKSAVEHSVRMIQERVLHKLNKSNSIESANIELLKLVNHYINDAPFRQSLTITRTYLFNDKEKLAARSSENIPTFCKFIPNRKVSIEYHVKVLGNFYSVPFEYAGFFVDIEIDNDVINILSGTKVIAVHKICSDEIGKYITKTNHMPQNHRAVFYNDALFQDPKKILNLVNGLSSEVLAFCLVFYNSKHSFSEIKKACTYVIRRYKQIQKDEDKKIFNKALSNLMMREDELEKVTTYSLDEEIKIVSLFK